MNKILKLRNAHIAILLSFVIGLFMGASLLYLLESTPLAQPLKVLTLPDREYLLERSHELVSNNDATSFSDSDIMYEYPLAVIHETVHEKLKNSTTYTSDYTIAFIRQNEQWVPIYLRRNGEIINIK